jgi:hypothetical protein
MIVLCAVAACGQPDASRSTPASETSESASESATERASGAETANGTEASGEAAPPPIAVDRHPCEPDEERAVDVARVLPLAIASIREAERAAPIACADPVPACLGPADGSRCVYELALYPDVIRVMVWPRADDGAIVQAEAVLARDLSGAVAPARVEVHRWAVAGAVRCRGESDQRSYGGGPSGARIGPVTTSSVRITCDNDAEAERPLRVRGVTLLGPRQAETAVRSFEPRVLSPGGRTSVTVAFEPVSLALRDNNAFRVDVEIDGRTLSPVAQVTTPERMRPR